MNPTRTLLSLLAVLGILLSNTSCAPRTLERKTLEPRLARIVSSPGQTVAGEALLQRPAVVAFYKARRGEPAWGSASRVSSVREAILAIGRDGLDADDYHLARIDSLFADGKGPASAEDAADLEILLSDAVAAMIDHARYGRVLASWLDDRWNADPRENAPPLADALARVAKASSPADGIEQEKLDHFVYRGLKDELARLEAIAQAGSWQAIPAGRKVAPGARDPRMPLVRARLAATGDLAADDAGGADSTMYDVTLEAAVKRFQERHRLEPDGALDAGTIAAMSVPVEARIAQVKANLERARWVLPDLKGDFVLVNLPAFKAYLIRDGKVAWESLTQIGKEARQTPSFRADMKFVVFNPTWTVPPTILKEDVLGGIARGEDMLAKKKLKVYDAEGNPVDPKSVDWDTAEGESFPYTLRQDAGADNALGRMKFMFPNAYDIYLHDTPSRDLFAAEERTFSSGCIRLEDPMGLARAVLGDKGYDDAKIEGVIADGKTTQVDLTTPLPVLIVYWTVSVGASGEVRYGPDVYERDGPVLAALGAAPRPAKGS